jgi:hypothetical protein
VTVARPAVSPRRVPDARDTGGGRTAYHRLEMLPPPALLVLGLALAFVVLLPARRLQLAGLSGRTIGFYASVLWALAFFLAIRPAATRFLIPILLIAYIAPFVVAPDRLGRIVRRGRRVPGPDPEPRPMKNVTPPALDRRDGPNDLDRPNDPIGPG